MASLGIDKLKPRTESNSIDYDTDNLTPLEILNKIKYALTETKARLAEYAQKEDIEDITEANDLSDARLDTLQSIIDARTLQSEYDALALRQGEVESNIGDLSTLETYDEEQTIVNSDLVSAIGEIDRLITEKGTAADKEIFETEQEIGKWIDGKKLYRYITRYYTEDMTNNPNSLTYTQIAINSSATGCYTNKSLGYLRYYEADLPTEVTSSDCTLISYDIRNCNELKYIGGTPNTTWYHSSKGLVSSYSGSSGEYITIGGCVYPFIDRTRNKIIFTSANVFYVSSAGDYSANYEIVYYYTKDE